MALGDIINSFEKDTSDLKEIFPNIEIEARRFSEKILKHKFTIFGIEKDFGDRINWHLDPKTGKSWPLIFWGDINYRDGKYIGGAKFAWELNRFHHFPLLAVTYILTNDQKYKNEIFYQIDSWLNCNPYPKGLNWIMGIELGIRVVNLVFTLKLLGKEALSEEQLKSVIKLINQHGRHLYRYPSKYSSSGNHAIAEALGLFTAGLCFPNLKGANTWKKFGKETLEKETFRQIYPDGSSFEHSIPYLQFVIEHILVYYLLCEEYHESFNRSIEERLVSSLNFISNILDKKGNFPLIGDSDDGYLLKFWFNEHNNFFSILILGSILFHKSEWVSAYMKYDLKTYLLLGKKSKLQWTEVKSRKNIVSSKYLFFNESGLAVVRDRNNIDVLLVGNSGPLGLKPLAGHGHSDALSFYLSVNGNPIFVDPGTYLYHSGGEWRMYFKSTLAHNTIRIDSRDQADNISGFIFENFYSILNPSFIETEKKINWSAGHDGYMRLKDPVFHERRMTYFKENNNIFINDFIYCNETHLIECFFHLHPSCDVSKDDFIFYIECDNLKIKMTVDEKWSHQEIARGRRDPLLGWYSPNFNQVYESSVIKLSRNNGGNESFLSLIELSNI